MVTQVGNNTPRILCNNETVGQDLGLDYPEISDDFVENKTDYRDVWLEGSCDEATLKLGKLLPSYKYCFMSQIYFWFSNFNELKIDEI